MKLGYKHMRCGLIGEHLGHSFSGPIHAAIADYTYDIVELPPDAVGNFVKNGGYDAFNVTIPYKQTVIPFLDTISPEAQRIGAVNTVVRHKDGTIHGYNTDYFGFSHMVDLLGIDVAGKKAIVFGTGGASLTACTVLRDRKVGELAIIGIEDNTPENLKKHSDAEIVVNTTPVGMYPHTGKAPVALSVFPNCIAVLDVIYNPARTALLLDAESKGIPYINGLYMLVAQAVKAFEFFTGDPAEPEIIEQINRKISAQTRNVILIGMPGCGKSTAGKLLAQKMNRPFYDADDEFTKTHGMTPATAIQNFGEDRFREMEHEVLCELGKMSNTVIACGGGVVTREYNYVPLHQNGVIIYLQRELSRLATDGRPLSQKTSLDALYLARKDAYERFSDLRIKNTEIPDATVEAMLSALDRFPEE